jgi:hypothetical protein
MPAPDAELQEQHDTLLKQSTVLLASKQCEISERAETTYLNIIGGMLTLMLGQSPSGVPYSSFKTQEASSRHWSPTTAAPWASRSEP